MLTILWFCLVPDPPQISSVRHSDKLVHFFAFSGLFLWFGQLYRRSIHRLLIAKLVLFGLFIEISQSFTQYRSFELADLIADSTGVFAGWLLCRTRLQFSLYYIETQWRKFA